MKNKIITLIYTILSIILGIAYLYNNKIELLICFCSCLILSNQYANKPQ